ncbi:MAG: cysteine peptidase family C39 domain-containing protein [Planctomycetota bacterium]
MSKKALVLITVSVLYSTASADRQLDRTEILQILEGLTSQPRKTWIPSGTINASREEYRAPKTTDPDEIAAAIDQELQEYADNPDKVQLTEALQTMRQAAIPFNVRYKLSNEYTMTSNVIVKYDGDRFYWQIEVESRTDSLQPPEELEYNFLTEQFSLTCNQNRIFAWDGVKYSTYSRPINHAIITDTRDSVDGPLTAGVIPWGYGRYSFEQLSDAQSSATEIQLDGQTEIQLTITRDDRQEVFTLDPAKDYALKQYSLIRASGTKRVHTYGDYQLVGDNWCPASILIERYEITETGERFTGSDLWGITSISAQTPPDEAFEVTYEFDAYIEDLSGGGPLAYHHTDPKPPSKSGVDADELITSRLMIASAADEKVRNCATAAVKYVADQLDKDVTLENVTQMLGSKESGTSLLAVQQAAEKLGFHCKAIKADVAALKDLADYKVILHLPRTNHFVVLGDVDDKYVRLIDLANGSAWDGTTLLVADKPITPPPRFAKIDGPNLAKILGGCPAELCNTPCSSRAEFECVEISGFCTGDETIYIHRSCCGGAPSGNCYEVALVYKKERPCDEDPITGVCEGYGDWTKYYMQACQ